MNDGALPQTPQGAQPLDPSSREYTFPRGVGVINNRSLWLQIKPELSSGFLFK